MACNRPLVRLGLALVLVGCGGDDDGSGTGDAGALQCVADGDCDDGVFCNGVERCDPGASGASRLGCVAGDAPCLAGQTCDESAASCATSCAEGADADGDGHDATECGGPDCDDSDAQRYPGNPEVCDDADRDEDCDATTFGARDGDGDGYVDATCCNHEGGVSSCGNDCDDTASNAHPAATEACDGLDNDCDGSTDEGVLSMLWPDADGDMFGDSAATPVMGCPALMPTMATNGTDCDDAQAGRNPGLAEVCDGIWDNDCNPATNPFDGDGDMHDREACGGTDCNDTDPMVSPDATESCDGIDDDCDGAREDHDMDGYLAVGDMCVGGFLAGLPRTDCDDRLSNVHPGVAADTCDSFDNDCDGATDEDGYAEPVPPTTTGDATCVGGRVRPVGGATRARTFFVQAVGFGTVGAGVAVEIRRDDDVTGPCSAPSCTTHTTGATGRFTASIADDSLFAYRVAAGPMTLETLGFDVTADSMAVELDVHVVTPSAVPIVASSAPTPAVAGSAIIQVVARSCNRTPMSNIVLRLLDGTTPICVPIGYGMLPRWTDAHSGSEGTGYFWNVPVPADGRQYTVEAWAVYAGSPTLRPVGRERLRVHADAVTRIVLDPLRSDGP